MTWVQVDLEDGVGPDGQRHGLAADVPICLIPFGGAWVALRNACTHEECELSDGFIDGHTLECPCHGAMFDVRTGAVIEGPASVPVEVFPVRGAPPEAEVQLPS